MHAVQPAGVPGSAHVPPPELDPDPDPDPDDEPELPPLEELPLPSTDASRPPTSVSLAPLQWAQSPTTTTRPSELGQYQRERIPSPSAGRNRAPSRGPCRQPSVCSLRGPRAVCRPRRRLRAHRGHPVAVGE